MLINFDDTTIIQSSLDQHFEISDAISSEDGLAFAFAFTSYDDSLQDLDPDIGSINGFIWQWGFDEDFGNTWTPVPSHSCTREELGLTTSGDEAAYLYPL